MPSPPSPRLWCTVAPDAPVIAVFARFCPPAVQRQRTRILRWNWKTNQLDAGSTTTLRFSAPRCRLSRDGVFLLYHAKGARDKPFDGFWGGGYTISRLPYLAALTDIKALNPIDTTWKSRHALSSVEQAALWTALNSLPPAPHFSLAGVLGPAWSPIDIPSGPRMQFKQANAAVAPLGNKLQLLATLKRSSWDVWNTYIRFFLTCPSDSNAPRVELPDVVWAAPLDNSRVAVATSNAELQLLRVRHNDLDAPPKLLASHSLANLKAHSVAAPPWATARLKS